MCYSVSVVELAHLITKLPLSTKGGVQLKEHLDILLLGN